MLGFLTFKNKKNNAKQSKTLIIKENRESHKNIKYGNPQS